MKVKVESEKVGLKLNIQKTKIMEFLDGFSQWLSNKESTCNDLALIPETGRSPGEGNGNPLQYSCLGNPMDKRAWWATVHGVAKESETS